MSKRCNRCQKELTSGQIICLECATELKAKPTLEDCIKEWEEKKWKLVKIYHMPIFGKCYQFNSRKQNGRRRIIEFRKDEQKFTCKSDLGFNTYLSIEELELAFKTLKAMENYNETK